MLKGWCKGSLYPKVQAQPKCLAEICLQKPVRRAARPNLAPRGTQSCSRWAFTRRRHRWLRLRTESEPQVHILLTNIVSVKFKFDRDPITGETEVSGVCWSRQSLLQGSSLSLPLRWLRVSLRPCSFVSWKFTDRKQVGKQLLSLWGWSLPSKYLLSKLR